MNHQKHSYMMIGLLIVGAVLFFSGVADGGALFLLWPLACMGMMGFMMWGMTRGSSGSEHIHRHDDGKQTTHSHR